HLSDRLGVYGTQVISCAPREATYVLTSILDNDTSIDPEMHTTDTHGFTESLWGLCYLLGIDFMPRLKDLAYQRQSDPGFACRPVRRQCRCSCDHRTVGSARAYRSVAQSPHCARPCRAAAADLQRPFRPCRQGTHRPRPAGEDPQHLALST